MVEQYAHDHLALAYTPVAVAMTRGLRHSLRVSQLPVLVRMILDLRQYAASPQAASDAPQVRKIACGMGSISSWACSDSISR
ncbi:hypothetical protein [Streptomyces sp. NPDC055709]